MTNITWSLDYKVNPPEIHWRINASEGELSVTRYGSLSLSEPLDLSDLQGLGGQEYKNAVRQKADSIQPGFASKQEELVVKDLEVEKSKAPEEFIKLL